MRYVYILLMFLSMALLGDGCIIIPHTKLTSFINNGNELSGVATKLLGAKRIKVWKSTIGPRSCTLKPVHNTQEIFVFLSGREKVEIDEKPYFFEAPCTLLCPSPIPHQIFNTGEKPTEQIAILSSNSEIRTVNGEWMQLPWRR